jgi:4-hydroxy-3-polyprenylbenzoate decarboxylase
MTTARKSRRKILPSHNAKGEKSVGIKRIVVGLSGASGAIHTVRLLDILRSMKVESHLVVSPAGEKTLAHECGLSVAQLRRRADYAYESGNMGAAISSGSFPTTGMVIAPCSMRSLAEIASGVTTNLLTRAADVTLKERRRLILMVRESPLHLGHLENMMQATRLGAIIAPPMPAFYARPKTVDDIVDHSLSRVLDLLGLPWADAKRWGQDLKPTD